MHGLPAGTHLTCIGFQMVQVLCLFTLLFSFVPVGFLKSAGGHDPESTLRREESSIRIDVTTILPLPLFRVLAIKFSLGLAE